MLRSAIHIARKDIILLFVRSSGILQSILLGILLIFLFSLSQTPGEVISAQTAAVLFCLSSIFCQVLITNSLFSLDDDEGIHIALLLAPMPLQSIALGKFIAGFLLLLFTQAVLLPTTIIFLSQGIYSIKLLFFGIFLLNSGVLSIGILLSAISPRSSSSKDSLMTVLIFPLLIPLLLATIRIIEASLLEDHTALFQWFSIAITFNIFFITALLTLFPFLYSKK